jgi:hypothetical protein
MKTKVDYCYALMFKDWTLRTGTLAILPEKGKSELPGMLHLPSGRSASLRSRLSIFRQHP